MFLSPQAYSFHDFNAIFPPPLKGKGMDAVFTLQRKLSWQFIGNALRPSLAGFDRTLTWFCGRRQVAVRFGTKEIGLKVNGVQHMLEVKANQTLLEVLRNELGLTGTKAGCWTGDCGACTVLLDGKPVNSCFVLAGAA